jgi:hypothetical protein
VGRIIITEEVKVKSEEEELQIPDGSRTETYQGLFKSVAGTVFLFRNIN